MAKGKLMNPVDKARRDARKKELKKNKKQRQQVRSTIIEEKDPEQVIADLEKLDRLEFDADTCSSVNENIMKDKRKKLKDIWDRIISYYSKEDTDKCANLKKIYAQYESNHQRIVKEFQAIKAAQEIKLEDIFLPHEENQPKSIEIDDDDPLLLDNVYVTLLSEGIKPPGCPPGPPPDLNDLVDEILCKSNQDLALVQKVFDINPLPLPITENLTQITRYYRNTHRKTYRTDNLEDDNKSKEKIKEPPTSKTKTEVIIESKPMIFKPRSTQFIPIAVRKKMKKANSED